MRRARINAGAPKMTNLPRYQWIDPRSRLLQRTGGWNITRDRMGSSGERTVDIGEKVHFSWPTLLSPDYVPRSYIDDSGKAAEPTSRLNLVHGLFCFRTICHPLSERTYSRPAPRPSPIRYLWSRRRLINFCVSFS